MINQNLTAWAGFIVILATKFTVTVIMGMFIRAVWYIIFITIIFIKGLLFMKDTALLGTLFLHELIVHSAVFPRDLLLLAIEGEKKDFRLLLFLLRRRG